MVIFRYPCSGGEGNIIAVYDNKLVKSFYGYIGLGGGYISSEVAKEHLKLYGIKEGSKRFLRKNEDYYIKKMTKETMNNNPPTEIRTEDEGFLVFFYEDDAYCYDWNNENIEGMIDFCSYLDKEFGLLSSMGWNVHNEIKKDYTAEYINRVGCIQIEKTAHIKM